MSVLDIIGNINQLSYVLLSKKGRLSKTISDVLVAYKIKVSCKKLPKFHLKGMKVSVLDIIGNINQ